MKKIILIFTITLIVSCKKERSCSCYQYVTNSTGTETYSYYNKQKGSKRDLERGACKSYTTVETNTSDNKTIKVDCKIN